jgi:hypothetical protein
VGCIVASLADPYDDDATWTELGRVLTRGGYFVLTSPSIEWAHEYRARAGDRLDRASFELPETSAPVNVPSYVRSVGDERRLAHQHGFVLEGHDAVMASAVPLARRAPKIPQSRSRDLPLVRGFRFRLG